MKYPRFSCALLLSLSAFPLWAASPAGAPLGAARTPSSEPPVMDAAPPTPLEDESPGWAFGAKVKLDYCSKQLTYGLIDNPQPIFTPSLELSFGHADWFTLALSIDAIFDTTNYGAKEGGYNDRRYKYQELTPGITLSRTWKSAEWLGSDLETSINYTYEYHPRSCKKPALEWENPDTQWLNLEISAPDYCLVPHIAVEYQLARQGAESGNDGKGAIYATFDVSHTFDLGTRIGLDEEVITLTPTIGFGVGNKERNACDFGDWYEENGKSADTFMLRDGFARLDLAITPFENFTLNPYIGCHQQLDSTGRDATGSDDFVAFAGIALSYSF